ncbi:MAG: hydroxyacid dehydrogenase [Clostridia bacterium]|nr:hydroxyacid dehydrogenase [Clostridia bacterium]
MKVYLNDPIAQSALGRLKSHVEIVDNFDHPEELDAIIVRQQYCTKDVIRKAKRCKLIQQHGVGLDRIDVKAAEECGILVKNTPGGNSRSVAEYTVAMMLDLSRKVTEIDKKTRRGKLPRFGMPETIGSEITHKRLGLIGSGHIAYEVAQICRDGFHMEIYCHSLHRSDAEIRKMGFIPMTFQEIFSVCDYVSLHCLLTPESYHLVDRKCFEDCNPNLILVNTARGGLVDEEALFEALVSGKIAAAGLDVFECEPPSSDHSLLSLENFLAGMHVAGSTYEALERNGKAVVDSVFEALGIDG